MGNKLSRIANRKDKTKEVQQTLDNLPGLVCVTDNLPAAAAPSIDEELKTSEQFEEYFKQIIRKCIACKAQSIDLIPPNMSGSSMPSFKFPYTLFKECSSNLVELSIVWPQPQRTTQDSNATNSFPSDIFDHLPNLKTLNLGRYSLPYLSDKIGNLSNLESLYCYGSQIMCFPRTMFKLKKLTKFDPYCSYQLHYLPYEMKECPLKDSRISTGALWNNYKNKQLFAPLPRYPHTFVAEINDFVFNQQQLKSYMCGNCALSDNLNELIFSFAFNSCHCTFCSICKCNIIKEYVYYIWVFERIGTDSVGLLGRMCPNCIEKRVKSKDFIANNKKCDVSDGTGWSEINWSENVGENERFLYNKKGKTTSAKTKCVYERNETDFYKIPPMRVSWKYTGFESSDYNMHNVVKSWIKFWRYNLLIDFEGYELCTNTQTDEVNVIFI